MPTLTIELPSQQHQTAFNLRRWAELVADRELSPGNTQAEIDEKTTLYFDAGAQEVWIRSRSGAMKFYEPSSKRQLKGSRLCITFSKQVKLP
jgi:hypothetical protein